MSRLTEGPAEAGFVPLPPLQLAMRKYRCITGLQLVHLGIRNPEQAQGRSSALGPLSWPWQKGQVLVRRRRKSDLNHSTLAPVQSPQIPHRPSGVRRSPAGWRWAVSSQASLLETSQPCLSLSIFMDPWEHKRLGIWDSGFWSPKQSRWEYLAQLSALSVL